MRSGQIRKSCGGCNNAGCRSFIFVDARRPSSPCDTSRKKATHLRCSDSFHSLLSVFPCGSPMALREKRQRTFGAPTRFTPCCRIFRADRFALRENPQRSLRSLLRLRLQGREIRKNFLKTYAGLPLPVTIRRVNGQMVGFQTVTFQKPTISLKNIRLTCGDAGICARFGSGE